MKKFIPERLLSYVVAADVGLAPNVMGGVCTLAVCKPVVRSAAQPGQDWIIGMSTSKDGCNKVIYVMQVDEKISYADFFADKRFAEKKTNGGRLGRQFF